MTKFIITNLIFIIGMVALIINHVTTWWIWLLYIALWTIADYTFAKEIHLKWWHWVMIIALLSVIDLLVIKYVA